jgi:hypothetical protein
MAESLALSQDVTGTQRLERFVKEHRSTLIVEIPRDSRNTPLSSEAPFFSASNGESNKPQSFAAIERMIPKQ